MIIDAHAHYEPRLMPLENLIQAMDQAGIAKTILIPALTDPPETKKADFPLAIQRFLFYHRQLRPLGIAITKSMYRERGEWNMWWRKQTRGPQRFSIITNPANASVADAIARYPDRLAGWIFVNPARPEALAEIERWRNGPGMIGIKIHPFWHQFPMVQAESVARRARELNLPLLVHLGFEPYQNYRWLAERYPGLKLILAHLGIPYYADAWLAFGKYPGVYFDIASTYHVDQRLIRLAVKTLGADKILFGTDRPYAHANAAECIKSWVENLALSDGEQEKIFHSNIRKIAGI